VEVDKAVDEAILLLNGPLTILLNFAGIVSCIPSLDIIDPSTQWRRVLDVNTTGSFIVSQAVAKRMVASSTITKDASIVLVGSIAGKVVLYPQPQAAYNTAKAGVVMLARCLAAEWAVHGIRVNSISPGYMDTVLNEGDGLEEHRRVWTERNPMGRMGTKEELCGVVVLLCSRAGSYMNGADIVVDGGQSVF